jgi:hypothetical protein
LKACLLLLCIILGVYGQTRVVVSTIDPFSVPSPALVIVISTTTTLPFSIFNVVQDSSILGVERDLVLTAQTGAQGRVFNSDVSNGAWNIATPTGATGTSQLQYDGIDGSSALNPTGLGGVDLTHGGKGDSFKFTLQTSVATTLQIEVTDTNGGVSNLNANIPANPGVSQDYYATFSSFSGNAAFTKAGAVAVTLQALNNVDVIVTTFAIAGPTSAPPPPAAVSPTSSPLPGAQNTWYRFDDDDNNEAPCGEEAPQNTVFLADNQLIYYYFYGFQRPYIYVSKDPNDATVIIPSIFACIFALLFAI